MRLSVKQLAVFVISTAVFWAALGQASWIAAGESVTGVVNINKATVEHLQLLPGIGSVKAKAIVQHRSKRPFASPKDLLKVKGIGKGLYQKIRAHVVVTGETTLKSPSKKNHKKKSK